MQMKNKNNLSNILKNYLTIWINWNIVANYFMPTLNVSVLLRENSHFDFQNNIKFKNMIVEIWIGEKSGIINKIF